MPAKFANLVNIKYFAVDLHEMQLNETNIARDKQQTFIPLYMSLDFIESLAGIYAGIRT